MEDLLLRIETALKQLLEKHYKLEQSHAVLVQQELISNREKNALLVKQQKVAIQVETLLTRLKSMEVTT